MATSRTSYLQLLKLGAGDSLSAEGYDFTSGNMDKLDRAIQQALRRPTGAVGVLASPIVGPELTLDTSAGSIPAGTTVDYVFSYVDASGGETAASPIASITTPAPIPAPDAPVPSRNDTGGSLLPGNYFYILSAYAGSNTSETRGGDRAQITLDTSSSAWVVTLTYPSLPAGADGWNVYRRAPGETEYSFIASVASGPTTFVDNGSAVPNCTRRPPTQNRTNSSNSINVSLPGVLPELPAEAAYWKVYRRYSSSWGVKSLLQNVVEETSEGSGVIVPDIDDIGVGCTTGRPLNVSQVIESPERILLTDMTEVNGVLPVSKNVVPFQFSFAFPGVVEAVDGTFVWMCEYEYAEILYVSACLGRDVTATDWVVPIVKKWDGTAWTSIMGGTTYPDIFLIDEDENESVKWVPATTALVRGDKLVCDIDDTDGTSSDLLVNVYGVVRETMDITGADEDDSPSGIVGLA